MLCGAVTAGWRQRKATLLLRKRGCIPGYVHNGQLAFFVLSWFGGGWSADARGHGRRLHKFHVLSTAVYSLFKVLTLLLKKKIWFRVPLPVNTVYHICLHLLYNKIWKLFKKKWNCKLMDGFKATKCYCTGTLFVAQT